MCVYVEVVMVVVGSVIVDAVVLDAYCVQVFHCRHRQSRRLCHVACQPVVAVGLVSS